MMIRENQQYQQSFDDLVSTLTKIGCDKLVPQALHTKPASSRNCWDRLALIRESLPASIEELSLLDLGCANGVFANGWNLLGGAGAIGIDNNTHAVALNLEVDDALEVARRDAAAHGLPTIFINQDLMSLFSAGDREDLQSDVTFFLSVFHHLFGGYGYLGDDGAIVGERARPILSWIDRHTKAVLYFEIHEGIFIDWSRSDVARNLRRYTSFTTIEMVGETLGYEGKTRGLWRCQRGK
jgi:SAM-dependent methyltransferase